MDLMPKNKKGLGILNEAPAAVLMLVIIGIFIGVGATILGKVQDTQTAGTVAHNATSNALAGLETFSGWQTTIAIIIAAVIVIGLVLYLKYR